MGGGWTDVGVGRGGCRCWLVRMCLVVGEDVGCGGANVGGSGVGG